MMCRMKNGYSFWDLLKNLKLKKLYENILKNVKILAVNLWFACASLVFCGSQYYYASGNAAEDYNSIKACIVHHPVYCLHATNDDECYPDCSVVWQEQKSSLVTIISSHSSTCSVIFKHTCLLSALLYAVLFGPTAESSSGPDSGSWEEYCSQAGML